MTTPAVVRSVTTGGIAYTIIQVGHFDGLYHEGFTAVANAVFC